MSRGLSEADLSAVADLERRVVAADGGRLKLSWPTLWSRPADEVHDALAFDGDTLVGFAGIYSFGSVPEVAGMVDPAARRRGVGSALLRGVLAELTARGCDRALLVCPRTATGGGAAFARAHGGSADHSEHALALHGPPADTPQDPQVTLRRVTAADATTVRALLLDGFGDVPGLTDDDAYDESHVLVERDGEPVGYLRTNVDGDRADVYGFVVRADLRGRGIGRDVLSRVCRDLARGGARTVGLEVETDNEHALGLYTSVGFRPVVTEDYWGLTVRV